MAELVGLGAASWKRLELEDRAPKGEVLAQLVGMGFSSDWLLTGNGTMRRDALPDAPSAPPTETIDELLMGRLNDGISAVYKGLGQAIPQNNIGRLAARLYNEVTAAADKPEEIEGAIKMRLAMLRAELRAAEIDPLKGKRSTA